MVNKVVFSVTFILKSIQSFHRCHVEMVSTIFGPIISIYKMQAQILQIVYNKI